jgi:hypothetical protein
MKEYQQRRKEERYNNANNYIATLDAKGVQYEICNFTTKHTLVVGYIDFWPTTGTWRNRRTKQYGKGIQSLLWEILGHHAESDQN